MERVERDVASALVGTRVRVTLTSDATLTGTLRALTPAGRLVVANERGAETFVAASDVRLVEDVRFTCTSCGTRVNRAFGDGRCAECERAWAARQPVPREVCPDCGEEGAVYSPRFKVWRCPQCHAKAGSFSGSTVEARALQARCRTADKDSPLHDWKHFKSQWVCRQCEVKVFGKPAHA